MRPLECSARSIGAACVLRMLVASLVLLWVAPRVLAAPPRYVPEFLDPARLGSFDEVLFCCSLNDVGQVLGTLRRDAADDFAEIFVWDTAADTVEILPVLNATSSLPSLNDAGHVLGTLPGNVGGYFWSPTTGVVSSDEAPFDGATLLAFNDVGQVLVDRANGAMPRAFALVDPFSGAEEPIDPGPGGDIGVNAFTFPLNNLGQLAIGGSLGSGTPVHFWDPDDGFRTLDALPGSVGQIANGSNDLGQIVGDTAIEVDPGNPFGGTVTTHVLWEDVDALPMELPCVDGELCQTSGISIRGQPFGFAVDDDDMIALDWVEGEAFFARDLAESVIRDGLEIAGCVEGLKRNDLGQRSWITQVVPVGDPDGAFAAPCISNAVPTVQIESPSPGAVVDASELLATGFATDESEVASVFVNGIEAALASSNNPEDPVEVAFQVLVPLVSGANEIVAVASDVDGNTDEDAVSVQNEGGPGGAPKLCDVDGNDFVDSRDVDAIFAARGGEPDGPDDPRDANEDGVISINDGRLCVLECDLPECARPPAGGCGLLGIEALLPGAWLLGRRRFRAAAGTGGRR